MPAKLRPDALSRSTVGAVRRNQNIGCHVADFFVDFAITAVTWSSTCESSISSVFHSTSTPRSLQRLDENALSVSDCGTISMNGRLVIEPLDPEREERPPPSTMNARCRRLRLPATDESRPTAREYPACVDDTERARLLSRPRCLVDDTGMDASALELQRRRQADRPAPTMITSGWFFEAIVCLPLTGPTMVSGRILLATNDRMMLEKSVSPEPVLI